MTMTWGKIREWRACWHCHTRFLATRADIVYCSKACGYAVKCPAVAASQRALAGQHVRERMRQGRAAA